MKRNRIRFIFTYGTLMASEKSLRGESERALITAQCKPLGDAAIRGRMFDTGDYPGAVLGAARGERIEGELWQLPDASEALLAALDRYEGCAPDSPEPQPYARSRLRIRTEDGRRVTAWIYLWVAPTDKLPRIAGGRWHTRNSPAHHAHTSSAARSPAYSPATKVMFIARSEAPASPAAARRSAAARSRRRASAC